jgi:hypothetical protein
MQRCKSSLILLSADQLDGDVMNGFGQRRAGPHLLDRLLDCVQRRGVGGAGHVVTQNPAGGEEPAKCTVPVPYNSSSFSTWTTHHGGKAAVNAQLR